MPSSNKLNLTHTRVMKSESLRSEILKYLTIE